MHKQKSGNEKEEKAKPVYLLTEKKTGGNEKSLIHRMKKLFISSAFHVKMCWKVVVYIFMVKKNLKNCQQWQTNWRVSMYN